MIDIGYFQTLLLLVCVLAFVGGVFAGAVVTSRTTWLRIMSKLFFALLAITGGMGAVLLVLLK